MTSWWCLEVFLGVCGFVVELLFGVLWLEGVL